MDETEFWKMQRNSDYATVGHSYVVAKSLRSLSRGMRVRTSVSDERESDVEVIRPPLARPTFHCTCEQLLTLAFCIPSRCHSARRCAGVLGTDTERLRASRIITKTTSAASAAQTTDRLDDAMVSSSDVFPQHHFLPVFVLSRVPQRTLTALALP